MPENVQIRAVRPTDQAAWQPLWDGYNAFYGRAGATALPQHITDATWSRFFDTSEPVFGLVAERVANGQPAGSGHTAGDGQTARSGQLVGLVHYLYHRSTTRFELTCYLQDLFTAPSERGTGVGRALIQGVYAQAKAAGIQRVYWQTHQTNAAGRLLYDKVAQHMGFIVYSHDVD